MTISTERKCGILGQALAVVVLTAALAGCGGSGDTAGAVTAGTAATVAPSVSGTPPTTVAVNNRYSFQPTVASPSGTPVSFSIKNKPAWASFGLTTGTLAGTPSATDSGTYPNIVIAASDGTASTALPAFAIQVTAANSTAHGSSSSSSGGTGASASTASANGTMIPSATQILDSAHNVWTVSSGVVIENGHNAGSSANVALLLYSGGTIYHQNKSCLWWSWSGSAWVGTSNPAPSITPACSVTPASAASASSSSSGGSGSPSASGSTAALLSYITALPGQTKHILSGQHSSYWDSNPLDYIQAATSQTGKTVAIMGTTSGQEGSIEDPVAMSNAWLAQGGIPMVSWWPFDPFTNAGDNNRSINFSQLLTPGNAAYTQWYKYLDAQIAILKQIKGPVLYRPLLEMNGNWSWWGGQNTGQFVQLWQEMHAYFASKGVTNALWVFSPNGWSGNYTQYYAGPANVDIVAWDAYPPSANDPTYGALVGLGKPIMIAETGISTANNDAVAPFSGDNSQLLATVKSLFPKVFAVVLFCQHWALSQQNGAAAFMNDPATIAMHDLPSGVVAP